MIELFSSLLLIHSIPTPIHKKRWCLRRQRFFLFLLDGVGKTYVIEFHTSDIPKKKLSFLLRLADDIFLFL